MAPQERLTTMNATGPTTQGQEHPPLAPLQAPRLSPIQRLRRLLLGRPISTEHAEHTLLPKILALPVFASDAISSVAYATQQILLALSIAGAAALVYTQYIAVAIAVLLVIVGISYTQTIFAYPSGGGSYIVAKD